MKQMVQFRYADFLSELRQGRYYGIFVDDTGSPGLTHSSHLHPERKSWVAVVIPPNSSKEVLEQMPGAIEELRISTGAKEFHFADIYAGRKDFKGVDLQLRLAVFRFMAHMFAVYKFPVIVQTIDPINVADIHKRASLPKRIGPFNFTKPTDLSLFFLLVRVKWFLQEGNASERALARVFVDEGFQKNGAAIKMPTFKDCFADELVCFARSDTVFPIQMADFAAFCLNRTQLILAKPELSDLDRHVLEILSPMAWNYVNLPRVSLNEWTSGISH
jgi:hypothetical protein